MQSSAVLTLVHTASPPGQKILDTAASEILECAFGAEPPFLCLVGEFIQASITAPTKEPASVLCRYKILHYHARSLKGEIGLIETEFLLGVGTRTWLECKAEQGDGLLSGDDKEMFYRLDEDAGLGGDEADVLDDISGVNV